MVTTPSVSYQPSAILQGEPQRENNTVRQEPKENQVQPKQAAAADSQSSDQTSNRRRDYKESSPREEQTEKSASNKDRGNQLDIEV